MSVRAALPKAAESARLALAGAAAVLVLSTAAVQPALANSCGSMPTGAWSHRPGQSYAPRPRIIADARCLAAEPRAACVNGVPISDVKKPTAAAAAEKKAATEQAAR